MTDSLPTADEQWEFNRSRHQDCPKCGEDNPIEAVMCWACYTPLGSGAAVEAARKKRQAHERATRLEDFFCYALPFAGIALFIASGYARKIRFPLVGVGLLSFLLSFVWSKRRNVIHARNQAQESSPIEGITNTFLLYAVRDGASKIRLRTGIGTCIHYLIGEEWREQMKLPIYIWSPLCDHLLGQSDNWTRPIVFESEGARFEFSPHFERERDLPLETLTLSLLP